MTMCVCVRVCVCERETYLITGMLAECCKERMLSDSIKGQEKGVSKGS